MRLINLSGTLPATLAENTAPWDWFGQLRLSIDPASIRFVDLVGPGADFFDVRLNRQFGTLEISPFARADFEALSASPTLSFTLRFFMADGSIAESASTYAVTVLDRDDTPPQALWFASGGTVNVGAQGAVIGTLAVSDPDTASGFTFRLRDDDAWMFEVSGSTLRLKPGLSLSAYDGPVRSLFVEASDGTQSAGFELRINVANPALPGAPLANLVLPGEEATGFSWSGGRLKVDWALADIAGLRDFGPNLRFTLRDGRELWAPQPQRLDLLDVDVVFDPAAPESRLWAIFETGLNREPDPVELAREAALFAAGWFTELDYARWIANGPVFRASFGALDDAAFARRLYSNVVDWDIGQATVTWHAARLAAGLPREALLLEVTQWRRDIGSVDARLERGLVTGDPTMRSVDVLLRAGLNEQPSDHYRKLDALLDAGALSTLSLSQLVTSIGAFQQKWGWMDNATFARAWYAEARGGTLTAHEQGVIAGLLDSGAWSRADYMNASLSWWGPDAYVRLKPQGDFDFGW
ncbi:hypothetical protein ACI6QG_13400 [Roseococcus sp. DSY-14]|uniref:hypothetical protein n=1 Tax=Roseococcus sp. DSY-14 TaxID=3369650 RepID=UPI00387B8738